VNEELEVLKDVTNKLDSINVNYMLTGSLAMMYYGVPRMTRDLDVVIELKDSDIDTMVSVFTESYYIDNEMIRQSVRSQSMFNVIHTEYVLKVDFIIKKRDEYREHEFSRRKLVFIDGVRVYVVSKEDLILSKLVWLKEGDSEVQVQDIRLLCQGEYDTVYVDTWSRALSVKPLLDEVLHG